MSRAQWWAALRLAIFAAATVALAAAIRAANWPRIIDSLHHANPGWLAVAALANAAILFCWASFWMALRPQSEAPISYSRMLEIVSTASALMNTLPFGGGHASSVVVLVRRGGLSRRGAISLMALDQLGEGLVKIALLLIVLIAMPLPGWMRAGITTLAIAVAGWFAVLAGASRWAAELSILADWRRAMRALAWVLATKVMQLAAIVAAQLAFDVHVGAAGSLLVLASVTLASMISVAPGNLGTFEAGAFLAYRSLHVGPELALSLAIAQHICFLLPAIGGGYVAFSAQTLSRMAIASR